MAKLNMKSKPLYMTSTSAILRDDIPGRDGRGPYRIGRLCYWIDGSVALGHFHCSCDAFRFRNKGNTVKTCRHLAEHVTAPALKSASAIGAECRAKCQAQHGE